MSKGKVKSIVINKNAEAMIESLMKEIKKPNPQINTNQLQNKIKAVLQGNNLQEMREFLIGEGYHPDDIEEMVSMTRLDADEFEETFGLLDVEDEYEEMVGTSRRRHAARQAEKEAAKKREIAAARRAEKARLLKIKQDNNARDKRVQDREKAKKKQERDHKKYKAKQKATEQERKDIRRKINKDKPLKQRSYSNRKYEEPGGMNPNKQIGGRGKKHMKSLVESMLNKNIDTINAQKAKWKKAYKGLHRKTKKKMNDCIAEGNKRSALNKGYDCDTCCNRKFQGGQNNTICKERCKTKFPDKRILDNPMLNDKYNNDAYEFGKKYQDLKF